jgi:4-hydroxybenzoate polyprenyltransferase/geranylgeranylglycerol-phosphate geranylgeranyltransferase
LVGTLRDIDGDREGGYRTFPVVHGVSPTVHVIAGLFLGAAALAVVFAFTPLLLLAIAGQIWVTARLYQRRTSLTRQYALRMHEVLCVQRLVLASSVIAHGAGSGLALLALLPAVVITVVAQQLLRTKHEFVGINP